MGKCGRIEQDKVGAVGTGGMNAVDQPVFGVALQVVESVTGRFALCL